MTPEEEEKWVRPKLEEMYAIGSVSTNMLGETRFNAQFIHRIDEYGDLHLTAEVLDQLSGEVIEVRKAKPEDFEDTRMVEGVPEGIVLPEKYYFD